MPFNATLTDSEGFDWDINSSPNGNPELGIDNGTDDAFDGGMRLRVNGVAVNPDNASLDGREVNTQPIVIGGIVVQRSIVVSDATISGNGFARFLDSFTNTTDAEVTITVETLTNSGADSDLLLPFTSTGDTNLDGGDVGFVTSDGFGNGDPRVMIAYGTAGSLNSLPANVSVVGDNITVTHTITLRPGETRSLLQFATQNAAANENLAGFELAAFTQDAVGLDAIGALAGLSREEMLSIVNYTGFDPIIAPLELRDSEGNLWTITRNGTISSADGALNGFGLTAFRNAFTDFAGSAVNAAENSVTVINADASGTNPGTVTYEYTALEGLGVIRLLVTYDDTATGGITQFNGFSVLASGPNGSQLVGQVTGSFNNQVTGVVIDDSVSGSGGTVPAATVVWGAIDANDSFTLNVDTLLNTQGDIVLGGVTTQTFVYFLAVNDTGIAALADLIRFATPGPELLAYMSAAEVAALRNFDSPNSRAACKRCWAPTAWMTRSPATSGATASSAAVATMSSRRWGPTTSCAAASDRIRSTAATGPTACSAAWTTTTSPAASATTRCSATRTTTTCAARRAMTPCWAATATTLSLAAAGATGWKAAMALTVCAAALATTRCWGVKTLTTWSATRATTCCSAALALTICWAARGMTP
jgi:hypothetical protein